MTRKGNQGVGYERELRRKVLTDGGREKKEGEERGREEREKRCGGRLLWSPVVWIDTLWKPPEGKSSKPLL